MHSRRFISVALACFILILFYLSTVLAKEEVKITDIKVASGKAYQVGKGGLQIGTIYYIDRAYVVTAMPKELEGIQWIMTANDDKNSTGPNFLTLNVDRPAVIWVAHDSRGEKEKGGQPPQWLADGFKRIFDPKTKADYTLAVTDANMGTFNLWKQSYKKGSVSLGGNADPPAAGHGSNYTVLVEADESAAIEAQGKLSLTWGQIKSAR